MADLNRQGDVEVNIVDKTTQVPAQVDSSGNLKVITPAPAPPTGTDPINIGGVVNPLKLGGYVDTTYTITNNKILTIQRFSGGTECSLGKIELWWDPDGDMGINSTLIKSAYLNINNFQFDLDNEYTGDGTARIVLRSTNNTSSNSNNEFAHFFDGYEYDV